VPDKVKQIDMQYLEDLKRPTKREQETAMVSYTALSATLERLASENLEIEIEETSEKIKIPLSALKLLARILRATSEGKPISIIPIATEMTTQAAAELLGCSRPHFVKLLETGEMPFTKVGKHRRVKFEDVMGYKKKAKEEREALLIEIMKDDEASGLYDSQR
jgi:excisionase family DNA binding protein